MLYSYKGNYPEVLPNRIRLSNGETRTDSSTFTAEQIADAGYTQVDDQPEYNPSTQKMQWSYENANWEVLNIDSNELDRIELKNWESIREERDSLLEESDIYVIKELENDNVVSNNLKNYRENLRNIPQTYSTTTDVEWPDKPWIDTPQGDQGGV